ncbi:hypothetical protein EXIGLDRAFT_691459 [Exidia glandulosa HHB12029]|uniref:NB-ARC domain-containing protein n=1 Tax=Exidia glandulosa HHB12029 TaxID=1314781 RepID=A0A165ILU2_EXIGL|nr:hypothetical protein EXIGLDRAFT_691459 [Exidia glandulosa HHB12029]
MSGQIATHALSIASAIENACVARSLNVLEPFAAVAVEEIGRLLDTCAVALDKERGLSARLKTLTLRPKSTSLSGTEATSSLHNYHAAKIEGGQSQLVFSGMVVASPGAQDPVIKTALLAASNMTNSLRFPIKNVIQTVLQFYEHIESSLSKSASITALLSKVDDFVKILAQPGGQNIVPGEKMARAVEEFFRAIQSIIVRLEILKATETIAKYAAPDAVQAVIDAADASLYKALILLHMSLQVDTNNTVHQMWHAQRNTTSSEVRFSSALPARPKILHGRDEQLHSLVDFVVDGSGPIRLAIMGAGGLGKTTLARALVQDANVAATFGDRRFFVSAEAITVVDELVTGMLTTLGLSATSDPLASLLQHFRSQDRTLLVIDNLETIWNSKNSEQRNATERVLSQLDEVVSLTLIITCRGTDLPPDITWANRDATTLSTLSPEAALATFTDIAGDVPAADKAVRDALLDAIDYMPLAVTLLARLVPRGHKMQQLYSRWESVRTRMLCTHSNGRLDNVDASIQLSIAYLPSDDPAPLQLLSLCAQLPDGMRLPVRNELERLCGFRDLDGVLDVIQGLALVYVTDDDTIRMLSPIRLYVLEKHRPSAAHRASLLRIYYEIARHAPQDIDPQFPAARDRILPELSNLDALLWSEIQNFDELPSPDLIDAVNTISRFSSHHVPNERMLTALIPRIEHLPKYLVSSLWILADIHWLRSAYDLSLEAATRARSLYQSLGQRSDAADCDRRMGDVHRLKGNYPEAIACLSAARETFYELDNQLGVAFCDRDLAVVFYEQKNYDDAVALFTSAREVFLQLNEAAPAAFCQEMLGDIYRMRGDYRAAETQLESALQTYTSLGSMADIASCSCKLGDVYCAQRRFDAALERLQVAYDIGQKQGNTLRIANALRFRSYIHRDQGQFAEARRLLLEAQRLYESIESTIGSELCEDELDRLDSVEQA